MADGALQILVPRVFQISPLISHPFTHCATNILFFIPAFKKTSSGRQLSWGVVLGWAEGLSKKGEEREKANGRGQQCGDVRREGCGGRWRRAQRG